ncbi:hypothetical protein S7335_3604 [Synechococcus sp. PCC 7335]|uniref:hypothetical protein n=1 Tax=Synechococcus sp. (strain ATCC 29403 / PCC 7335) TaxID=91464 RepID=UPI00017EBFEC|nr:hypothetical protein [Synechococcus sp. PCC 7335]EDX85901.1 hypothetical protein S7335_3604 [Synechococcus sp. PCC 7335]
MASISKKAYREASEFIHGNFHKIAILPEKVEIDLELLSKWLDLVEINKLITVFVLAVRFSKDLNEEEFGKIEETMKDELGSIEPFAPLFT